MSNTTLNLLGFQLFTVETNGCILIAFIDYFQSREMAQSLSGRILFGIGGKNSQGKIHNSEPEPGAALLKYCLTFLIRGNIGNTVEPDRPKCQVEVVA